MLSRSFKNCSKFAFIQKVHSLTLTCSQTNNNCKSKKTAFFQMVFLFSYENVFHDGCFITILFDSFFTLLLVLALSLARVSQRFIQKTIVRLCVCVFLICVCVCVSVLFLFLGVYLWLAVYLLQYQIANMVQISQINLICFFLLFSLKYIMIFLFFIFYLCGCFV